MKFRSVLVAATTAALVVPSGAAVADSLVRKDAAGDVSKSVGQSTTVDPTRTNGDITGTVIKHAGSKVKIKIYHRDLAKTGYTVSLISVRSNKGKKAQRNFSIAAIPGAYYGKVMTTNASGKKKSCKTTKTLDYAANTTLLVIPRSCLGNPKWVRVGIGVVSTADDFETTFVDDARTKGTVNTAEPVISKRVYR